MFNKFKQGDLMHWFYLALAIVFEVAGTTSMKLSNGFSKMVPSILMAVFYILSLTALTFALKKIDMSIAYAVWAGVGTALITIIGLFLFGEKATVIKLVSILFIIAGVVGLHLSSQT